LTPCIGRPDGAYQQCIDDDKDDARQRHDEYHTEPIVRVEKDVGETLKRWVALQQTPSSIVHFHIPSTPHTSPAIRKVIDDDELMITTMIIILIRHHSYEN